MGFGKVRRLAVWLSIEQYIDIALAIVNDVFAAVFADRNKTKLFEQLT